MLKYVRLSHPTELPVIVFCQPPLSHADLANAFAALGYTPKSAGLVSIDADGTARTHGESTSLNLKPDMSDALRIGSAYRFTSEQARGTASVASVPPLSASV